LPDVGTCLIVGLGNPGPEYADTRHNVGFQTVARWTERHNLRFSFYRFRASVAEGKVEGEHILVARPLTYMNDSGQAVAPLVHHYRVSLTDLLVVYDDLDLPLGKIRLRARGSSGGHRGLESILRHLGMQDVPRLRIGIGRPQFGDPIDYVLEDWRGDELPVIETAYDQACDAIDLFVRDGITRAMNEYNA
jgi:peptidyl-tRNA hydrolase, PTH1 family